MGALRNVLLSGKAPKGLKLKLGYTHIRILDLINALRGGKAPNNLELGLTNCLANWIEIKFLFVEMFKFGCIPENLKINFGDHFPSTVARDSQIADAMKELMSTIALHNAVVNKNIYIHGFCNESFQKDVLNLRKKFILFEASNQLGLNVEKIISEYAEIDVLNDEERATFSESLAIRD